MAEPALEGATGRSPRAVSLAGIIAVFVGGAIGSSARDLLGLAAPDPPTSFPTTTFLINTSGALALGLILTLILARPGVNRLVRPFACVGVLGGWTTMSAFAVETDRLVGYGKGALAVTYVLATSVAGVLAAGGGAAVARVLGKARDGP